MAVPAFSGHRREAAPHLTLVPWHEPPDLSPKDQEFTALVEAHSAPLYRLLLRRTGKDRELSADLLQGAFLKAYEAYDRYQERGLPVSSWLYRIAINHHIDYARGLPKAGIVSTEAVTEIAGDSRARRLRFEDKIGIRDELDNVLSRLTPTQRQVLEFRFLAGLTHLETAVAMGRSEDGVKKLQARGLAQARKYIERSRKITEGSQEIRQPATASEPPKPPRGVKEIEAIIARRIGRSEDFQTENRTEPLIKEGPKLYLANEGSNTETSQNLRDLTKAEERLIHFVLDTSLVDVPAIAEKLGVKPRVVFTHRARAFAKLEAFYRARGQAPSRLSTVIERLSTPPFLDQSWAEIRNMILPEVSHLRIVEPKPIKRYTVRDLSVQQAALAEVLFPSPENYPLVTTIREAEQLAGLGENGTRTRKDLAYKLSFEYTPAELSTRPRTAALLNRLRATPLYAYTTAGERDKIMWFKLDKADLETIAEERALAV